MLNQWIRKATCILALLLSAVSVPTSFAVPSSKMVYTLDKLLAKFESTGASQDTYGADVDLTGIVANVGPTTGQIYLFADEDSHGVPGIFINPSKVVTTSKLMSLEVGQTIRVKGRIHLATGAAWYIEPQSITVIQED